MERLMMMNELAFGRRMRNKLLGNILASWTSDDSSHWTLQQLDSIHDTGVALYSSCFSQCRGRKKVSCKIIADAVSVKSTILCYMWASLPFEDLIVISREESWRLSIQPFVLQFAVVNFDRDKRIAGEFLLQFIQSAVLYLEVDPFFVIVWLLYLLKSKL